MSDRTTSGATGHVFLVEDDEHIRELLRLQLLNAGFTVEAYGSAVDYLAKLRPEANGCLVTDVRMEPIDGVELVAMLRGAAGSRFCAVSKWKKSRGPSSDPICNISPDFRLARCTRTPL